ncbi:MAG: DUF3617 domain-containing protein [Pseudomonadota bacterium]|nr:DUF3617 family protein [Rhodocyclaceae bacterium]
MKRLLAALAFATLTCPAIAQEMSPGLWELTTEMKMQGMAMPPQKFTHCYTAQDLAAGKQYGMDEKSKCTIRNLKNVSGNISYEMTCEADGSKMTGSVKGTMSATAFSFEQKMRMTPDQGMGDMLSLIKGRRIGDCKK